MTLFRTIIAISILVLTLSSCKTTNYSRTKALPIGEINEMSLEEWTDACEKELDNPETSQKALADLTKLAGTPECEAAYPVIKQIFAEYVK